MSRIPAVLAVALSAAPPAQDLLDEQVAEALRMARPVLMAHLERLTATDPGGALGLACLAALHDGVSPHDRVLAASLARLAKTSLHQTYPLALRLMVAEACPQFPDRTEIARADARQLLRHRHDGAFGYGEGGRWDLSNTQYAALGLRAAAILGVEVPRRVWSQLADKVVDSQRSRGGFAYTDVREGDDAYASMTAAGIAVLAICCEQLEGPGRSVPLLHKRIARGWEWFAANKETIGDLRERWSLYFHYGLERAAILCDVTEIDGVDWYRTGARMLVGAQGPTGGWTTQFGHMASADGSGEGTPVDTAFAVLFLRRKFQKTAGPTTGARTVVLPALTAQSGDAEVRECAAGLVRRGKSALRDVLLALRDPLVPRRRAAALALHALAGEDFGYDPERPADANEDALRRAELWYLRNR